MKLLLRKTLVQILPIRVYKSCIFQPLMPQCDSDTGIYIFIVAFLENATIGYSLESLCVCVCVCPCLCVCVFLHDNSKRNRSRNTKSEYIVVYENSSDEFDIELHRIKVKVTVGVQKFSPFTTIQTVRSYSSTLVEARNLILSIYLHLILIYKIN